jgi:putative oxidoreductase
LSLQVNAGTTPGTSVSLALLFVRIGLAAVFMFHGAQKMFGAFGGKGLADMMQHMGPVLGFLVSFGEFFGGLAVLVGLLSRFSGGILALIMVGAIAMVHGKNGFSAADGGYEFNLVLLMMGLAVFVAGPGRYALARVLPAKLKPWLE